MADASDATPIGKIENSLCNTHLDDAPPRDTDQHDNRGLVFSVVRTSPEEQSWQEQHHYVELIQTIDAALEDFLDEIDPSTLS